MAMVEAVLWERWTPGVTIGRRLYGFGTVTSTMDVAWDMLEAGVPHGSAALAEVQVAGRGRFGRAWISTPGDSLLLSVALRPPPALTSLLTVVASLAVRDAVRDLAGLACAIKWPNDIQIRRRKLCGILAEGRTSTNGESAVVVGIGLNVNLDIAAYETLGDTAASLRSETGHPHGVMDVAVGVLAALGRWYTEAERGADVIGEWRTALNTLGKRITVRGRDRVLAGIAEEVDAAGRLLLRTDDGTLHTLSEGDVSLQT